MLEPKVTFGQGRKVLHTELIVPLTSATITFMDDQGRLNEFAIRLNEVCDDMLVPPKGQARQTQLAKLFGLTQKGVRKWLEGEGYPSIAMGVKIAEWANVSFDWLMTGRGPKVSLPVGQGGEALSERFESATDDVKALINLALQTGDVPENLSPSVTSLINTVLQLLKEQMKKPN